MTQPPNKPKFSQKSDTNRKKHSTNKVSNEPNRDHTEEIVKKINDLPGTLQTYPIRLLVEHAQELGPALKRQRLETNQIRKFLDAINRIKSQIAQTETQKDVFVKIEPDIVLLKPKLAYAAARQRAAKPLSQVMSTAIDKVHSIEDFNRLVQFIESIIAYHKAEGGK
ncbi:type III-A CRISPR-associated protein Csm2 [Oscillatoria salina]|uniref:type III-A CRISPR-associated protein Csm2 n=1 Tax=Oscillatoria salina TaxID=331517 RepID=UPI001CCE05BC|nr:type III-A CRISPR-associated protein Csm2 [Oscillatoria salina]MBZ8182641.1 type III-A CRISPR-associated protein Csm2 [Oscillatoria salina IIICB1]